MHQNIERINKFLRENRWLLIAAFFLLAWKIFLVFTLWNDRVIPPEPDDSYIYITHIESIKKCPSIFFCEKPIYSMSSFGGYSHLTYRVFFGYLAIIFNLTSEQVFHFSFYIGSVLLVPVLWLFLKSLNFSKNLIAFSFLFALLAHGGSATHSFAWMVPSYFALMFILLIYSVILGEFKRWKTYLALLIPLAVYTHTIVIYLIFIPVLYECVLSIFNKKIERNLFKKVGFSLLVAFVIYAPLSLYLAHKNNTKGNPYGIEIFLTESIKIHKNELEAFINKSEVDKNNSELSKGIPSSTEKSKIFPGYQAIKYNYLQLVVLNPFGFLALAIFTATLLYYERFKIISIFFSALIFVIFSSINYFGFRALLLLWPLTFIFYSAGFWYFFKFLGQIKNKRISFLLKIATGMGLVALFTVGLIFSYLYHVYDNEDNNIYINKKFVSYLEENIFPGEKVIYSNHLLRYLQWIYRTERVDFTKDVRSAKYYVYIKMDDPNIVYENSKLNKFIERFYRLTGIERDRSKVSKVIKGDISRSEKKIIEKEFDLEKEFGRIKIYRNSNFL